MKFLFGVLGLILGLLPSLSQGQTVCEQYWNSSLPVPSGYASSFNVLNTSQSLLTIDCSSPPTIHITIGNNTDLQAVYKTGYLSKNGAAWTSFNLTSSNPTVIDGNYFSKSAVADLNISSGELADWNYIAFVVAYHQGTRWKYGCVNAQCAVTVGWNIQAVEFPPAAYPIDITFSPSGDLEIADTATAGTVVTTATVTMSDASTFVGTLSVLGADFLEISGSDVVLSRDLTAGDVGDFSIDVTADQ